MSGTASTPSDRTEADWRHLWRFAAGTETPRRRITREVRVGDVGIGGRNPIRVQSMTIADTLDTRAVVDEIEALHAAGSEIVRLTAPNRAAAENLAVVRRELRQRAVRVPLVADIHFTPQAALIAALHVEKVRINPGNYADRKHFKQWEYSDAEYAEELERLEAAFRPLVLRCRERGVAMRVGTNHGSLSDRILNRYGDTPLGMVESALEFVRICEQHGYRHLVLSMKASDVKIMIAAYRLLAARMGDLGMDYPFHLGVTEAGSGTGARLKSAIGIGALLADGIGDTVRVSLTEDSVHELPLARALSALAPAFPGAPASALPAAPAGAAPERDMHTASAAADTRSPGSAAPDWDPFAFERRSIRSVGRDPARLALDRPPRIECVLTVPQSACDAGAAAFVASALDAVRGAGAPDLVLVGFEAAAEVQARIVAEVAAGLDLRDPSRRPAIGVELPAAALRDCAGATLASLARVSVHATEVVSLPSFAAPASTPVQFVVPAGDPALGTEIARRIASAGWTEAALAVQLPDRLHRPAPHLLRRFVAAVGGDLPIVWRASVAPAERIDAHLTHSELALAVDCGSLLADGRGDALQIQAPDVAAAAALAREILQATRARLSRADFIACPSCGRTQFDLQSTTARIEARFRHLEGLKIAVMGCIVNGPGEMADADFGYVGSGPGRIDLWVGRERVARNLPESDAAQRLEELIRRCGRWRDPGPDPATPDTER